MESNAGHNPAFKHSENGALTEHNYIMRVHGKEIKETCTSLELFATRSLIGVMNIPLSKWSISRIKYTSRARIHSSKKDFEENVNYFQLNHVINNGFNGTLNAAKKEEGHVWAT